jgi:hypothetical protein
MTRETRKNDEKRVNDSNAVPGAAAAAGSQQRASVTTGVAGSVWPGPKSFKEWFHMASLPNRGLTMPSCLTPFGLHTHHFMGNTFSKKI